MDKFFGVVSWINGEYCYQFEIIGPDFKYYSKCIRTKIRFINSTYLKQT